MDAIQQAQSKEYGFKSANTGDLSFDNARKLLMLKDYAKSLGLTIEANTNGIYLDVLEIDTRKSIAHTVRI